MQFDLVNQLIKKKPHFVLLKNIKGFFKELIIYFVLTQLFTFFFN